MDSADCSSEGLVDPIQRLSDLEGYFASLRRAVWFGVSLVSEVWNHSFDFPMVPVAGACRVRRQSLLWLRLCFRLGEDSGNRSER